MSEADSATPRQCLCKKLSVPRPEPRLAPAAAAGGPGRAMVQAAAAAGPVSGHWHCGSLPVSAAEA